MKIVPYINGKDAIAVIPTADINQERVQALIKEFERNNVDSIVVEDMLPSFRFAKSMNSGITEALKHNVKCIILSNDDISKIEGLEEMIQYVIEHKHSYVHPYVNGKNMLFSVTTSEIRFALNYTIVFRAPFYAARYIRNIRRLLNHKHFAVGIPAITHKGMVRVQPFGVFNAETLQNYKFDEHFINCLEDDELGYRLNISGIHGATNQRWRVNHGGGMSFKKARKNNLYVDNIKDTLIGAVYFYNKYFGTENE